MLLQALSATKSTEPGDEAGAARMQELLIFSAFNRREYSMPGLYECLLGQVGNRQKQVDCGLLK